MSYLVGDLAGIVIMSDDILFTKISEQFKGSNRVGTKNGAATGERLDRRESECLKTAVLNEQRCFTQQPYSFFKRHDPPVIDMVIRIDLGGIGSPVTDNTQIQVAVVFLSQLLNGRTYVFDLLTGHPASDREDHMALFLIPLCAILHKRRIYTVRHMIELFGIHRIIVLKPSAELRTDGYDKVRRVYKTVPESGVTLKGFQIPLWDEIVAMIKEASLVVPQVGYVGWDVAVSADRGPLLIEGNSYPGQDNAQEPDLDAGTYGSIMRILNQA